MLYPVPAALVSCGDADAGYNIITVAWTGIICSDPAMCYISVRPERHSHAIISKNREFTINLSSQALAFATDWCGVKSGKDVDKFKEMRLTPIPGSQIRAPLIKESPVNLECRVTEIKPLGSHDLFLAEIVAVHASDHYLDTKTGALDIAKAELIAYAHGAYYQLGRKIGKFGFSVEKKKKKKHRS